MKKQILMALSLVVLALTLHSCFGGNNEPTFSQKDLYSNGGLWLEDGIEAGHEHYVRFTTEKADQTNYLYGREWDIFNPDPDGMTVYEEDLKPYGMGWFKYLLEVKNLHELHLMDNHGAEIPKEYVVTKLTADRLEYYEKDMPSSKFKFNKVVETK